MHWMSDSDLQADEARARRHFREVQVAAKRQRRGIEVGSGRSPRAAISRTTGIAAEALKVKTSAPTPTCPQPQLRRFPGKDACSKQTCVGRSSSSLVTFNCGSNLSQMFTLYKPSRTQTCQSLGKGYRPTWRYSGVKEGKHAEEYACNGSRWPSVSDCCTDRCGID
jgi:hypothetical protein